MSNLADLLRALPDDALAALLRRRPDLVVPVPSDVSALAVRAQSRVSVARALDSLDRFTLQVLDGARLTRDGDGVTSVAAITAVADDPATPAALRRLRDLFLLYGPDSALRLAAGVEEVCSPYPAGLGRPAADLDARVAALCADPAQLRRTVLAAPPPARAVLDRLAAGPPVGTLTGPGPGPGTGTGNGSGLGNGTAPATSPGTATGPATSPGSATGPATSPGSGTGAGTPVRWLVDNALLVEVPGGGFELPREVGLLLRRDTGPLGRLEPRPPVPVPDGRDPKTADSAGAGQAMEAVRNAEALLAALDAEPAPVLRAGGVGVRELRRVAKAAGLDEAATGLLLEIVAAAGLAAELEVTVPSMAIGRATVDRQIAPTPRYDAWRSASIAQRWTDLAVAWLTMTRQPGLIGQRDERDRPFSALSPEAERSGAPTVRRAVLGVLAAHEPGAAPTADDVLALLAWQAPRRSRGREPAYRDALTEAATLGVTGLGALTSYGRLLLADDAAAAQPPADAATDPLGTRAGADRAPDAPPAAVGALDGLLPAPVDHVLVQADLTVVVPGPPDPTLAAELEAIADPESANVHRITPESVRRALDVGWAADDLHRVFARRSRTPVPQSLTYLVDDVARRHGGLRIGSAGSYLRSDDEVLLAELLVDRRLTALSLRRLAPTVLVTPLAQARLLPALREAGYAPVPEDATGAAVVARAKVRRAPIQGVARLGGGGPLDPVTPLLTTPRLLGIVEQIRRGEAAARVARRAPISVRTGDGSQGHAQALAVLQQAVRDKALVWVGYVDAHGATLSRLVRPVSIGAGYLRAEDERTETLHTFALHRVTAAVLDDQTADA